MKIEERIQHLKELIPLLPIKKSIRLQIELANLERELKKQGEEDGNSGTGTEQDGAAV